MSDLTAAIGVTKPSLYAAFGNKEIVPQGPRSLRQTNGRLLVGIDPSRDSA